MPPKKASDHTKPINTNIEANETKFNWTAQNDRALLILTFGRNPTTEDFQRIAGAFPAGVTLCSIRTRYSRLRMEMKKRYEELGWGVPGSVCKRATPQKPRAPATPKKRKVSEEKSAETSEDPETPVRAKKLRGKKDEGKEKEVKSEEMAIDQGGGESSSDDGGEEYVFKKEEIED